LEKKTRGKPAWRITNVNLDTDSSILGPPVVGWRRRPEESRPGELLMLIWIQTAQLLHHQSRVGEDQRRAGLENY
jgi:hypothetical protein